MGATKREVAEQLGVAKQTIVNYIAKLELADHVKRVGKTDVLDEFAVSAIADAVGKSIPQASAPKEDGVTTSVAAPLPCPLGCAEMEGFHPSKPPQKPVRP